MRFPGRSGLPEIREGDDLAALIAERADLRDRDVLVVAQKAVSKAEGRIVRLADVEPSAEARELAGNEDPRRLEVILRAPVASGLHSLSAAHLAANELPDEDALVCGDHPAAKQLALGIAERLVGGRAVDVGPLANSRALEAMTAAILNVNRELGVTAGLRLTGLP